MRENGDLRWVWPPYICVLEGAQTMFVLCLDKLWLIYTKAYSKEDVVQHLERSETKLCN